MQHQQHHSVEATVGAPSLTRTAAVATLHCLTGCAIGEVAGLAIGTALGWSNTATIVLSILLAFLFGYGLTMLPLLRSGMALAIVLPLALTSDTFSITVMEIVDSLIVVAIPGAMDAGLGDLLFWGSLALALGIAFLAAWPVNRWLIARGRGHAVVHEFHHGGHPGHDAQTPDLHLGRLIAIGVTAVAFTVGVGVTAAQIAEGTNDQDKEHAGQEREAGGAAASSFLRRAGSGCLWSPSSSPLREVVANV